MPWGVYLSVMALDLTLHLGGLAIAEQVLAVQILTQILILPLSNRKRLGYGASFTSHREPPSTLSSFYFIIFVCVCADV